MNCITFEHIDSISFLRKVSSSLSHFNILIHENVPFYVKLLQLTNTTYILTVPYDFNA